MTNQPTTTDDRAPDTPSTGRLWLGRAVRALLVLAILAAGGIPAAWWVMNRPQAERRGRTTEAVLVEVAPVRIGTEMVVVDAMGTVVPAREVRLAPRVGGEIVEVSPAFVPGGRFAEGDVIVRIDPTDYELARRRRVVEADRQAALVDQRAAEFERAETAVTQAEAQLAIEMGQQAVAEREYELLGEEIGDVDEALVLRGPQLEVAKASVAAAKAASDAAEAIREATEAARRVAAVAVEEAELDLARTTVRVPFNAVVSSREVNLGAEISPGAPIATLIGTDRYWVRVTVPQDELRWIRIPDVSATTGSEVRLIHRAAWGPDVTRTGRVVRLEPSLEPQGRMARLLVAVEDPLDLARPPAERHPLVLDSYIRVEIAGRDLDAVACVPRDALHEGDNVWVMDEQGKLDIRDVEIAWSTDVCVVVSEGLAEGERLVTSSLGTPVEGMKLRTADAASDGEAGLDVAKDDDVAEGGRR